MPLLPVVFVALYFSSLANSQPQNPHKSPDKQKLAQSAPATIQEKEFILFSGDKRQRKELQKLWDRFLAKAENKKIWEKLKNLKNFKLQRLEFGPTQGKLAYLESTKNGEVVIKINPKITYYSGLEEKTLEELSQAENLIIQQLGIAKPAQ